MNHMSSVPADNRISVVIIAQDDGTRITAAIKSCKPFADDIVVIDGGSKDNTIQVAESLGCRVFSNPWPGYAKQRMFGVEQAEFDWIFLIDTDEVVDAELLGDLLKVKEALHDPAKAYSVFRIGDFLGKWMNKGEHLVRLYNRRIYGITNSLVHEMPDVASSQIIKLEGVLWHYGFRSISDHMTRFNKYTDLEAETAFNKGRSFRISRLLLRPPARFVQKYFVQGLYRKGLAGFAVAVFWVMYEFLVCFKHYELTKRRKKIEIVEDGQTEQKGETSYVVQ
ncbi:glycosyltransferase family 2 protein [Paenibacillus sp. NRS-1782]|uniref:glycosyltransferase family 2 protein n=1 Tax=unclassified Paenibacillus TaxID=185978 RepID=UPI003D2D4E9D